jgi:hypothetical protein
VVIFETPSQRVSWAPHGVDGYYLGLGPALNHYRCYNVFVTNTKHTRVAETLSWHPHLVTNPNPNPYRKKSYEDLAIVESQVELMLKAVKMFKAKNSSDNTAHEYVMWAMTKIANDKATPQTRQFTTGKNSHHIVCLLMCVV